MIGALGIVLIVKSVDRYAARITTGVDASVRSVDRYATRVTIGLDACVRSAERYATRVTIGLDACVRNANRYATRVTIGLDAGARNANRYATRVTIGAKTASIVADVEKPAKEVITGVMTTNVVLRAVKNIRTANSTRCVWMAILCTKYVAGVAESNCGVHK